MPPQPEHPRRSTIPAASRRIDEFDVLRGISIVFVVYLHPYFTPWSNTPAWELATLHLSHLVAQSAVPVFLFMSGFLSARDHSPNFAAFARERLVRLVLPVTLWMFVALAYRAWQTGALTSDLLWSFALFDIAGQFYFLLVLVTLTFAAYPLRYWSDRQLAWVTVVAFVLNLATVAWYSSQTISGLFATLAYRNPLMWVFGFVFGIWLGRTRGNLEFGSRVTGGAAGAMGLVTAYYLWRGIGFGDYPVSYFGVTMFLFAALGMVVYPAAIRVLSRHPVGNALFQPARVIAPYAFAIYLVHQPYFLGYLTHLLVASSPFSHDYLTLVLTDCVVGGGSALLAILAINRVAPRFGIRFLGIERPRVRTTPAS